MWMHGPYAGGFSFFMIFLAIFLIFLLVFLAFRTRRGAFRGGCGGGPGRHKRLPHAIGARDLLDQRYARGEIDHEQYLRMKDALDS